MPEIDRGSIRFHASRGRGSRSPPGLAGGLTVGPPASRLDSFRNRRLFEQLDGICRVRIVECGGIDLQVLGIGSDGHIAFNEPSSSLGSRTRIKTLTKQTIDDNDRFFKEGEKVPTYAITMGVGTILEAEKIMLLADGEAKAEAVAGAIEGPVTSMNTASALQLHDHVIFYLDKAAAGKLKMREYFEWIQAKMPGAPRGARSDVAAR